MHCFGAPSERASAPQNAQRQSPRARSSRQRQSRVSVVVRQRHQR